MIWIRLHGELEALDLLAFDIWENYAPSHKIIGKKIGVLTKVHFMVISGSIHSEAHNLTRTGLCTGIDAHIINHAV